ncbi:MAG TPA: hypothetical protein VN851_02785 [Thermoanaerobaculia bacterium]|nr:hypothetical protein [Thermoanaerobaculia bacterium]
MTGTGRTRTGSFPQVPRIESADPLYFFPEKPVTLAEARALFAGTPAERAVVVSHLLRYAQWEDIWKWIGRDEVRELLPLLDLPDNLRAKWAHLLKAEAAVAP